MAGISFIPYNGARIVYQDWSYCKPDEIIDLIGRAKGMVVLQPKNSALVLINVKGASFNVAITKALREFARENTPYVKCTAVYGVEGLQEVIFKGILTFTGRKNIVLVKTLDEGKEFLANYQ
jgi:hypothetical protein